MGQIDDIGAVILALADDEEATAAFKRALGWHKKWDEDHVTIPRPKYEALMAATKDWWSIYGGHPRMCSCPDCQRRNGIRAALRVAGIDLEEANG